MRLINRTKAQMSISSGALNLSIAPEKTSESFLPSSALIDNLLKSYPKDRIGIIVEGGGDNEILSKFSAAAPYIVRDGLEQGAKEVVTAEIPVTEFTVGDEAATVKSNSHPTVASKNEGIVKVEGLSYKAVGAGKTQLIVLDGDTEIATAEIVVKAVEVPEEPETETPEAPASEEVKTETPADDKSVDVDLDPEKASEENAPAVDSKEEAPKEESKKSSSKGEDKKKGDTKK